MKTRILVTIGDINGIGPEIVLKTLAKPGFTDKYDLTVVTPVSVLEYYYRLYRLKPAESNFKIFSVCEGKAIVKPGQIRKEAGYVAGYAIKTAVELCLRDEYDVIVTSPISKKALNLGGFKYEGHTEMLTALHKLKTSVMVMVSRKLNIAFATTHPPVRNLAKLLTKQMLIDKLKVTHNSLKKDFGIAKPRIGVLSLNPHAGEGGQIGNEEIKIIQPAMETFMKKYDDIILEGPFPSDSYFGEKKYDNYDITFAMYHDQGFIPFKMLAGKLGTNFTAGLSFVRTSPDHGTAFDIAGKNLAAEASLVEAIKTADKIFKMKNKIQTK